MEVAAEKSRFQPVADGIPVYTDVTTGNVVRSPIKDISTARAVVSVRNEQTVVLGGMITREQQRIERKVPWIGDIPYLGIPFRYDLNSTVRTELLIFLTPRVVASDADSEWIKQVETQRIHFTEQEAEAIHGPILAVPTASPQGLPPEFPAEAAPEYCPPDAPAIGEPGGSKVDDDPTIPTTRMPGNSPIVPLPAPPSSSNGVPPPELLPVPVVPDQASLNRPARSRLSKLFKK
jgi:hypothetical protein